MIRAVLRFSVRRVSRVRGASLIEILLALAVFVTATAGIIGSYLAMHDLAEHATKNMRAVSDLQAIAERIASTTFQSITTDFPNGVANANGYQAIVSGQTGGVPNPFALPSESIIITYPSQTADRLEIVVTVNWTHGLRARSTMLSTVRTKG